MPSSLSGVCRTSSIIVSRRVELALDLQEPGVRERRAEPSTDASTFPRELEGAREQELRLVELEANDVCLDASACAAIVWRSLRPASSAITYARSMYAHEVLARSEPGADHRARNERVEVGDGVGVGRQDRRAPRRRAPAPAPASPSRLSDASPRAVSASASCTRSPSSRGLVANLRHLDLDGAQSWSRHAARAAT